MWLTVSIDTKYGGHSKQAGLIASQCHAGAYANRWVIVVDEDIDPSNMNDVIWAMCTRCDPKDGAGYSQWLLEHASRPDELQP